MVKRKHPLPKSDPINRFGVAWFDKETYSRIQGIMNDTRAFPLNYDQWRESTENLERYWKRRGHLTVRIVIDPDAFLAWCEAGPRKVNA